MKRSRVILAVLLLGAILSVRTEAPQRAPQAPAALEAEPVTEAPTQPATEAPSEPEREPSLTDQLRRQRLAASQLTGLDLPMNYPAQARHMTVTSEKLEDGAAVESSTVSRTVILDEKGNELGALGSGGFSLSSLYEYGENGQILRIYALNYGSVPKYQENTYREDGSVAETVVCDRRDDGDYRASSYTEFDSHGNITSEGYCYSGGRTSSRIAANSYNDSGDLVLSEFYQAYEVESSCRYEYDSQHRLVLETKEIGKDHLVSKIVTEYTYLKSGLLRQKTQRCYDKDGQLSAMTRYEYTYDEQDRISTETVRYGDYQISRTEYEYEEL